MYTIILNYYELKQIFEQAGTYNIKQEHTKKNKKATTNDKL